MNCNKNNERYESLLLLAFCNLGLRKRSICLLEAESKKNTIANHQNQVCVIKVLSHHNADTLVTNYKKVDGNH